MYNTNDFFLHLDGCRTVGVQGAYMSNIEHPLALKYCLLALTVF